MGVNVQEERASSACRHAEFLCRAEERREGTTGVMDVWVDGRRWPARAVGRSSRPRHEGRDEPC